MKRSGSLLILLGVLLALISSLGAFSVMRKEPAATPTPLPTVKVVVATQSIADRSIIQASMLAVKDWPTNLAPAGVVSNPQDLVGKIAIGSMVTGEPVLSSKVSYEQQEVGLAPTLPPGLVAMALAMSPVSAAGGAVRAGDAVDILISMEYIQYNEKGEESKPLHATFYSIQDVPVLTVDSGASPAASGTGATRSQASIGAAAATMLTVLVTPQDALLLKHAREKGSIDLVLRSPQYHDQVTTDPVYLEYIIRRFELPRPVLIEKRTTQSETEQPGATR